MDPQSHSLADVAGVIVVIASLLSNFFPAHTVVGKLLHLLAGNWRTGNLSSSAPPSAGSTP